MGPPLKVPRIPLKGQPAFAKAQGSISGAMLLTLDSLKEGMFYKFYEEAGMVRPQPCIANR